ncbi:helix-turn-helix domain-containing protein [Sphingomonas oryzagri]
MEPTLIFNTGAPISIVDASGNVLNVATGQAFFAGLHQRFCFSRCGGSQSGVHVRLSPQAAWRLLGPGAAACADHAVLVTDVGDQGLSAAVRRRGPPDPSRARAEIIELLDRALMEAPQFCPETDWSIGELARPGTTVAAVAAELGWSRQRLIARCRQVLGITPKVFGRIARYQRLLATLDAEDSWADRAAAAGYFDQSHMIRDFTAFTGRSPRAHVGDRVTFVQ